MRARIILPLVISIGCGAEPNGATMGSELAKLVEPAPSGLTVCADGPTVPGIDVSKWQATIEWGSVARAPTTFAFIRVSDGLGYPDDYFAANWQQAKESGVVRGAYQFFRADEDPVAQADYLLATMGGLEARDLPPVLDIETTEGLSSSAIVSAMRAWIDRVEGATGMKPIIYTGPSFWNTNIASSAFASYPLWVANWGATCPSLPSAWSAWALWQTSAGGTVAGITGNVDTNVFNGNGMKLLAMAAEPPSCGDGLCTGSEDAASCSEDCAACLSVPRFGRIVDDAEVCFVAGGAQQYIRYVPGGGYAFGLKWTKSWVTANVENYCEWSLDFDEGGTYRLEAYVDPTWGEWTATPYRVRHAGTTETLVVDQGAADGWTQVGELTFAAGGDQWVRLEDAVSSSTNAGKRIICDALRLVRTDVVDPDGGEPDGDEPDAGEPDGGEPDGGDTDSGATDPEPSDQDGGDPAPSDDVVPPPPGPTGGCAAASSSAGALATLLLLRLRRRLL